MKTPALLYLTLCLFLCVPTTGNTAEPPPSNFVTGNSAYDAGKFADAAAAYQREIHAGHYTANLFFNLANTEYRLGDLGRAVANYQRALLLDPRHAEAAANLAYVRGKTSARTIAAPENLSDQFLAALNVPDVNTYAIIAAVSGWIAAIGFCLGVFTRRRRVAGWILLGAMLPVSAASVAALYWLGDGRRNPERAIVLKDQTPARYAPADSAKVITKLPVGDEVRVLAKRGEWIYTQLSDGALGWLQADTVERIIPVPAAAQGSMK